MVTRRRVGSAPGTQPARRVSRAARDVVGVSLAGLGVFGIGFLVASNGIVAEDDAIDLMILGSVGLGAAAALLGDVYGRLSGDVRPSWIAAALALYTLVVVPSSTLWPEIREGDVSALVAGRLAVLVVILALLLGAVRPPVRPGPAAPWLGAGIGVVISVAAGHTAAAFPGVLAPLTGSGATTTAVVLAWMLASAWLVLGAVRRRDMVAGWMGLGFLLVSAAHTHRVATGREYLETDLLFGELRLLGMLTVLVGTLQLLRGGVQAARTERWELQEELGVAAMHVQRAAAKTAERDHELRNGLAGLTGITQLLSGGGAGAEHEQLRAAVLRELTRLAAMLEEHETSTGGTNGAPGGYDVTPVLVDAVMLQRAAGVPVQLSSPPGLVAGGSPDVLAQVVTNLLANCARHAPGATVRVRAEEGGGRVRIGVADDGPGIPPGHESLVLERGVRGPASGGDGLGLHVSRELLERIGGSLRISPRGGAGGGCTVVVELPGPAPEPVPLLPAVLRASAAPPPSPHVEEVR